MSTRAPQSDRVQHLWTAPDGTTCTLVTSDTPPFYAIALVRDATILRERRLYGLASAQMLAQAWCEAASGG